MSQRKKKVKFVGPFQSIKAENIFEEITQEEIYESYTIASALNFKSLGLCVAVSESGKEQFGTPKDLSPLGDMVLDNCSYFVLTCTSLNGLLLLHFVCISRMDRWICMLMTLMENAFAFSFPRNHALISQFQPR